MSLEFILILELVFFILIFVPTMIAFISGAPWVPTPIARCKKMVELAKLKEGDKVYDLGCGDGRLVHLAAEDHKADAVGIELSPLVYAMARVRNFFLNSKSKIVMRDFRRMDYGDAKVVFFYLLPATLKTLIPDFKKKLKPGTKLISYAFSIEGWEPIYIEPKNPAKNLSRILIYEIGKSDVVKA
ncbi:class I SAM-dependent methyltransferase [Candidatus Gracilibacteria bacterium]|nr:class I SAM-dependent methyltransferase [Candidatus Gracilibacteria bacterium]